MSDRLGVRGRLLLAFFGISAFAVLAAVAAMYSFLQVDKALNQITEDRVPSTVASQQLSRQAERIAAAAPAWLTVDTAEEHERMSRKISAELERLDGLLRDLRSRVADPASLVSIEDLVERLGANLNTLDTMIKNNLDLVKRKNELLRKLRFTDLWARRLLAPGILVMDAKLVELREALKVGKADNTQQSVEIADLARPIASLAPLQWLQAEVSTINNILIKAASAESPADLGVLVVSLRRSLDAFENLLPSVEPELGARLDTQLAAFRGYVDGADSIVGARATELRQLSQMQTLLDENVDVSRQLTDAVDSLVDGAYRDIREANLEARSVQQWATAVMLAVVGLSLLSSILIVWLYVDRNLVVRLSALSGSMRAIAGGDLAAPVPAGGEDELGRMARALEVFRDNAVEMRETNLRELNEARRRLAETVESVSEGLALYDADDRFVLCNSRYREIMYPSGATDLLVPGTSFETIIRSSAERGEISDAVGGVDAWVAERLARHRNPGAPLLIQRSGGNWVQVSERRTETGGTVAAYTDISGFKEAEIELKRYVANLSHEFRTPLNAIINYTGLVMKRARDGLPEKQFSNLEKVLVSSNQLRALINDILDISRIESGLMAVRPSVFRLKTLVDQCLSGIEHDPKVRDGQLQLSLDIEPDLPDLVTDDRKLTQILDNLLSNAVKFTETGMITVTARQRDSDVEIAVSDTGRGIEKQDMDAVFAEFRRVGGGAGQPGGTGLGLPISRRLAILLGGDIAMESEAGIGSTFTVTIPLRYAGPLPEDQPADTPGAEGAIEAGDARNRTAKG